MKSTKAPYLQYTLNMKKNNIIWVIEDDPIQVFIAKRMLTNMGISQSIRTMDNARDALEVLHNLATSKDNKSQSPDIIFLDINMPQMDGWQFLKEFEKLSISSKIDIYLLTSSIDPRDAKRARACDIVEDYLIKPVKMENLQVIFDKYESE